MFWYATYYRSCGYEQDGTNVSTLSIGGLLDARVQTRAYLYGTMVDGLWYGLYYSCTIATIDSVYGESTIRGYEDALGHLGGIEFSYVLRGYDRYSLYFRVFNVGKFATMYMYGGGITRSFFGIKSVVYGARGYRGFQYGYGSRIVFPQGAICLATGASYSVSWYAIVRVGAALRRGSSQVGTRYITLLGIIIGRYTAGIINYYGYIRVAYRVGIGILRQGGLYMAATYNATFGSRCEARQQFARYSSYLFASFDRYLAGAYEDNNFTLTYQY